MNPTISILFLLFLCIRCRVPFCLRLFAYVRALSWYSSDVGGLWHRSVRPVARSLSEVEVFVRGALCTMELDQLCGVCLRWRYSLGVLLAP